MSEVQPYDQPRYILKYFDDVTSRRRPPHQVHFHSSVGGLPTSSAVIGEMNALRDALGNTLSVDETITTYRYSDAGDNILHPIPADARIGSGTDHIPDEQAIALGLQFVGRTALGHPTSITIYGNLIVDDAKEFVTIPNAPTWAQNFWDFLRTHTSIIGADGSAISWYGYANYVSNKFWRRKARQS